MPSGAERTTTPLASIAVLAERWIVTRPEVRSATATVVGSHRPFRLMSRISPEVGSAAGWVDAAFEGPWVLGEDVAMPKKYPPEFKKDVAAVARRGDLTVTEVAIDFGVSEESVRRWMRQAEIDDGVREGKTTREQSELVQLRRDRGRLEMEHEILRRAAAYFASASLPK